MYCLLGESMFSLSSISSSSSARVSVSIPESSFSSSSTSTDPLTLEEVQRELEAIQKQPEKASQKTLDGLLAALLNIEAISPSAYLTVWTLKQELVFCYSLVETLQTPTLSPLVGGKRIFASFNQFSRYETRSSCAVNAAYFAKYFLSLKEIIEIDPEWVEKVTREGMEMYLTLSEGRQKGFSEVLGKIKEEARKQKTKELHDELSSLQEPQKDDLFKKIPLLTKEAIEIAEKNFWREQGGDHLAVAEVFVVPDLASLPRAGAPPTHLLSETLSQRKDDFQMFLTNLTEQTISKLACTLTCNGYIYGLGVYRNQQTIVYVIYDSHGNLVLNSSKYAFCALYEELPQAAAYLTLLVSYLDIPKDLQRAGTNEVTYMVFGEVLPLAQGIFPPRPSFSAEQHSFILQKYFKEDPAFLSERNQTLQSSLAFPSPLAGGFNKYNPALIIREYATCTLADSSTLKLRALIDKETHHDLFPSTSGGINAYDISLLVSEYLEEYATQEKNGRANPRTLYGCDDISDYLNLMVERELGGYQEQETGTCRFLLQGNKEGFFVENDERWLVALAPAIDTGGYLPLDHFLNETSQIDNTLLICYEKIRPFLSTLDKKNENILFEQLSKLLGSVYEKAFLEYLIEKLKHFAFNNRKLEAAIEDLRRQEQKNDVFRELAPFLKAPQTQIKILMPYNISQSHWLTAEIQIHKNLHAYQLRIWAHDPYGGGQMPINPFRFLSASITSRIRTLDPEAIFSVPDQGELSPYTCRQQDGTSCGVIVAADILRRIKGRSLNRKCPYPSGATSLREKHLEKMQRYLPPRQITREKFLKRNSQASHSLTAPSLRSSSSSQHTPYSLATIDISVFPKDNSFPLPLIQALTALIKEQPFPLEEGEALDQALEKAIQSNQQCIWYQFGQVIASQKSTAELLQTFCNSFSSKEDYPVQRFLMMSLIDLTLNRQNREDCLYPHKQFLEEVCYQVISKVRYLAHMKTSALKEESEIQQIKDHTAFLIASLLQKFYCYDQRLSLSEEDNKFIQEAFQLYDAEIKEAQTLEKSNLEKNYPAELRSVIKLGQLYAQIPQIQAVLQAAGFYNYALHLKEKSSYIKDRKAAFGQIVKIFDFLNEAEMQLLRLLGVEVKSPKECLGKAQETRARNLEILKKKRFFIKKELEQLGEEQNPGKVREVHRLIATEMKGFTAQLIKQCLDQLGPPPCQYTVIGLGSMAREEMTPYSDLEFAILIAEESEKNRKYFRSLTYLLHLKVINLKETILPALNIPCLKGSLFFDAITPRGFAFDGAGVQGKGCKTPLGNGTSFELIQTPTKMAQYIGIDREGINWPKAEPHLPMEMLNVTLITGEESLIQEYQERVTDELERPYQGKTTLREYLAKEHLREEDDRNFDPTLNITAKEGQLFKIKQDLYRLPHLSIDRLALLLRVKPCNTLDRIEDLQKQEILTPQGAKNLQWLMSEVIGQRLKVYIHYRAQQEWMNPLIEVFGFEDPQLVQKQFAIDKRSLEKLTNIYQILLPFHQAMQSFLKGDPFILSQEILWDKNDFTLGQIAARLLQYAKAKDYYLKASKILPEDGRIWHVLGLVETRLGNSAKALTYYQRTLTIWGKIYGKEHLLATSLSNIGEAYQGLGKTTEALTYYQKALAIRERIYSKEHPHVALSLNNIGSAYQSLGKATEGLTYFQGSLDIYEKIYGKEHPLVAISLNNIGMAYEVLGKSTETLTYLQRALAIHEKIYGKKHPHVAFSLNNIGNAYHSLGKATEGLTYFQGSLAIYEKIYGKEHPLVATSLNNIGYAYQNLRKSEEALTYHQRALAIWEKIYGKEHPLVATSLNNIGSAYKDLGKAAEALNYYQRALAIREKIYSKEHPDVAISLNNIGSAYHDLGKATEALNYYQRALAIKQKIYGKEHPDVATSLNNIGLAYQT